MPLYLGMNSRDYLRNSHAHTRLGAGGSLFTSRSGSSVRCSVKGGETALKPANGTRLEPL